MITERIKRVLYRTGMVALPCLALGAGAMGSQANNEALLRLRQQIDNPPSGMQQERELRGNGWRAVPWGPNTVLVEGFGLAARQNSEWGVTEVARRCGVRFPVFEAAKSGRVIVALKQQEDPLCLTR